MIEMRQGQLYCPAGDFYIDPMRPVNRAIITHGHGDHARSGSVQYYCAKRCLPVLQLRLGTALPAKAFDFGERFTLGDAALSFHSAGHVLGSAQLRIEVDGQVAVVTGDYKRDADPSCDPFELVPCDILVTESTFALPVYRWPPMEEVVQSMLLWIDECKQKTRPAILFAYSLGKAQRILAELHGRYQGIAYLHGAIHPMTELYRQMGIDMIPSEAVSKQVKDFKFDGELILAPPSASGSPWMKRFPKASTGFASGWMRVRGKRRWRGYDRGFVVSDHVDWQSLLQTIEQSGAREIIAYHGNSTLLLRYLQEQGIHARAFDSRERQEDE